MPPIEITHADGAPYTHAPGFLPAPDYPRAPRLIAICGRKRSGKDTAAKALRCFGYKSIAFAEPLKQMLVAFLVGSGWDHRIAHFTVYEGDREKPIQPLNGRSVRYALQTLGTAWGRDLMHGDLWRDATMRAINAAPERRFVVTDLRFPNEADSIKSAGGVIVRIERDLPHDDSDNHVSETLLESIIPDYVIHNVSPSAEAFGAVVQAFYNKAIATP